MSEVKGNENSISGRTDGLPSLPSVPLCQAASDENRERPLILAAGEFGRTAAGRAAGRLPRWQREYMRRFHRLFVRAEGRIENGQPLTRAFRQFTWWLQRGPRFYRCDPARPFRISEKHLIRLLYKWREGGRVPEALALKYRSGLAKIESDKVQNFAMACLASGISSLRQAHESLSQPGQSMHGYRHALPLKQRAAIVSLFAARRMAARLENRARRILEGKR